MRKKSTNLTEKELEIMTLLWSHGPSTVRELLAFFDEPKPHVNTVSTTIRILEEKGHVSHEALPGGGFRYAAVTRMEEYRDRSMTDLVGKFFNNSFKMVVSQLAAEEKITAEELEEILRNIK